MFIKPEYKIVSVEDTAELNLPHENWIPSVVRSGFSPGQRGVSQINLFDLLKAAVRQRPDYIIVGEVRGEEAYTLFQAMATGHLGMSTIHSESVEAVINRLGSEPMNVPRSFLSMIDVIMIQGRTEINGKPARRALLVTEILDLDSSKAEFVRNDVYRWDAKRDAFSYSGHSHILEEIKEKRGLDTKDIQEELHRRKTVLEWMVKKRTRKYSEVGDVIREYSVNPAQIYRKARMEAH